MILGVRVLADSEMTLEPLGDGVGLAPHSHGWRGGPGGGRRHRHATTLRVAGDKQPDELAAHLLVEAFLGEHKDLAGAVGQIGLAATMSCRLADWGRRPCPSSRDDSMPTQPP